MKSSVYYILLIISLIPLPVVGQNQDRIFPAAERTDAFLPLLKNKVVGIVANHTSMIGSKHLVDSLQNRKIKIKCIFAPEHGFRGQSGAGEKISTGIDKRTGLKVISLYGKHLKPTPADLKGIKIMLFDIQDVGARFYTYISTLQYVMEACAENNIPLIILDRPNPNGYFIDGPILKKEYASFVGMQPVPVNYGMTIGEYALMLNGEQWLKTKMCKLTVVPIGNYSHSSLYQLPVAPSPNLQNMDAIYLYPSLCFFEGTKVSLGRGTSKPFECIGFPGNTNGNYTFTPKDISGVVQNPPYKDSLCTGSDLTGQGVIMSQQRNEISLNWLIDMYHSYPDNAHFFTPFFDVLAGTDELRKQIQSGKTADEIHRSWKAELEKFKLIRKKYLLYAE